jgi:hypothetical protein
VYSYDASPFSIFENERPRRARSPKIENEDASEACLVHMLRKWLHAVASSELYVAEDMLEIPLVHASTRAGAGGGGAGGRRRTHLLPACARLHGWRNKDKKQYGTRYVHLAYVRISCTCRILSYVSVLVPSKDGRNICEYERSRTVRIHSYSDYLWDGLTS